ncbi:MAG: hypothetical protein HY367_00550 [Candidatus Aenigmarchaeota archaeon]|nr:hypothetical protein [Candidatus Aenigmarchaeota archaeon]
MEYTTVDYMGASTGGMVSAGEAGIASIAAYAGSLEASVKRVAENDIIEGYQNSMALGMQRGRELKEWAPAGEDIFLLDIMQELNDEIEAECPYLQMAFFAGRLRGYLEACHPDKVGIFDRGYEKGLKSPGYLSKLV